MTFLLRQLNQDPEEGGGGAPSLEYNGEKLGAPTRGGGQPLVPGEDPPNPGQGGEPNPPANGDEGGAAGEEGDGKGQNPGQGAPANDDPPGDPGEGGGDQGAGQGGQEDPPEPVINWQELSGGRVESQEQLHTALNELDNLRVQSQKPLFENDHQQALYDLLKKYDGDAIPKFADYLHLNALDLDSLAKNDPKTVLWEIFKRDEAYSGLPENKKKILFENDYEQRFGEEAMESEVTQIKRESEVQNAVRRLRTLQDEFRAADEQKPTPEKTADNLNKIKSTVQSTFGRMENLAFDVKDGDGNAVSVNVALTDDQKKGVTDFMLDVGSGWDNFMKSLGGIDDQGNVDYGKYASAIFNVLYQDNIRQSIYDQAQKEFEIKAREKASNKQESDPPPGPVGDGKDKKTEAQMINEGLAKAYEKRQAAYGN